MNFPVQLRVEVLSGGQPYHDIVGRGSLICEPKVGQCIDLEVENDEVTFKISSVYQRLGQDYVRVTTEPLVFDDERHELATDPDKFYNVIVSAFEKAGWSLVRP